MPDSVNPPTADGKTTPSHDAYAPCEMAARVADAGVAKARLDICSLLALSVLGGAFIGLGADFAGVVAMGADMRLGLSRLAVGGAFSLGLILVTVAGAELFTGNNLVAMAWASGRITLAQLARNWVLVYAGNAAGAIGTAILVHLSGQGKLGKGAAADVLLQIAVAKVDLSMTEAFFRGVLCNALVCLAVWLCFSARTSTDRVLSVVFPVSAFVVCGFEHSIANLFTVPLGLFLKSGLPLEAAMNPGLDGLTWNAFLFRNLLPVTLGNIVGGTLLVGGVYWFIYLRLKRARSGE